MVKPDAFNQTEALVSIPILTNPFHFNCDIN